MPLTYIIVCDDPACQNEAEWVIAKHQNPAREGYRYCGLHKRQIVEYESKFNFYPYQRTQFRREKKRFGA